MSSLCLLRQTAKTGASAVFGVALMGLLVAATPARAGDDDTAPDVQFLRSILTGLGLKSQDGPTINYEERPPLVIPSDTALPPPEKGDPAANNPAWPKDPDVARAKREKETHPRGSGTDRMEHESNPLRQDELTPGAKTARRASRHGDVANPSVGADGTVRLNPSELGVRGGLFSKMFGRSEEDDAVRFTGEPPRTVLTEPPPGYQTPSADQPYGSASASKKPVAKDYFTTHGELQH
jgi:hypothetical protein